MPPLTCNIHRFLKFTLMFSKNSRSICRAWGSWVRWLKTKNGTRWSLCKESAQFAEFLISSILLLKVCAIVTNKYITSDSIVQLCVLVWSSMPVFYTGCSKTFSILYRGLQYVTSSPYSNPATCRFLPVTWCRLHSLRVIPRHVTRRHW